MSGNRFIKRCRAVPQSSGKLIQGSTATWAAYVLERSGLGGTQDESRPLAILNACMRDSAACWVRVKSLQGEPCQIQCSFPTAPHAFMVHREIVVHALGSNSYRLELKRGEEILPTTESSNAHTRVEPVPNRTGPFNHYGVQNKKAENI